MRCSAIDDALAEVVASSSQPALGAIRLAWWREALERLDLVRRRRAAVAGGRDRAAAARDKRGGRSPGWRMAGRRCSTSEPDIERVAERGEKAVRHRRRSCSVQSRPDAGRGRAALCLSSRSSAAIRVPQSIGRWRKCTSLPRHRFPARLRPLTALAALAARDVRQAAGPSSRKPRRGGRWRCFRIACSGPSPRRLNSAVAGPLASARAGSPFLQGGVMPRFFAGVASCFLLLTGAFLLWQGRAQQPNLAPRLRRGSPPPLRR